MHAGVVLRISNCGCNSISFPQNCGCKIYVTLGLSSKTVVSITPSAPTLMSPLTCSFTLQRFHWKYFRFYSKWSQHTVDKQWQNHYGRKEVLSFEWKLAYSGNAKSEIQWSFVITTRCNVYLGEGMGGLAWQLFFSYTSSTQVNLEKTNNQLIANMIAHSVLGSNMTLNISNTNKTSIFYGQNVKGITLRINFCPKPSLLF